MLHTKENTPFKITSSWLVKLETTSLKLSLFIFNVHQSYYFNKQFIGARTQSI